MPEQRKRLAVLTVIMVLIATSLSMVGSKLLYETSLLQQRSRLFELVHSQASMAEVLIKHYKMMQDNLNIKFDLEEVLDQFAVAQNKFKIENKSGEFTVALKSPDSVKFLIVNGKVVSSQSPLQNVSYKSSLAAPMKKALELKSGTIIGLDYRGNSVLAAYTPIKVGDLTLGMVAKINMGEIRKPFILANIKIFFIGIGLILVGIIFFKKFGDPLVKDLEDSEREYRELVENITLILLRVDGDGNILFANRFAKSLLASKNEDIIGLNIIDILAGEEVSSQIENKDKCLRAFFGDGNASSERPFETDDGEIKWIAWRAWRKQDTDEITELLCVGSDITSKYIAQVSLQNSESQYRNLFENSPLAMVHFDYEGAITECNEIFVDMMGSSREKIIGFNTAKSKLSKMSSALIRALEGERTIYEDWYTSVTGGKTTFLRAIFNPVKNIAFQTEVIATLEDITERKRIEAELLESEERFREIINAAPVGMIIADFTDELIFANKRLSELTGIEFSDKSPKKWTNLIHPQDLIVIEDNWRYVSFSEKRPIEVRIMSGSSYFWTIAQIVRLDNEINHKPCFAVTFTDISLLKESVAQQKN